MLQLKQDLYFKPVYQFSSSIAGLQWDFRAIMYEEILRRAKDPHDRSYNPDHPNYVQACEDVVNQCIHHLPTSPYSQVQYWLGKTHPIAQSTPGEGKLLWAADERTMTYMGTSISIDQLGELFRQLTSECEEAMRKDLLFEVDVPFELPEVIHDDISVSTRTFSWIQHPGNLEFTSRYNDDYFMKHVVLANSQIREKMWNVSGSVTSSARAWLIRLNDFKLNVAVLLKLACACAMRDTEMLELVLEETATSRRSFYFLQGEMVVISAYDKMSYLRETVKNIPHSVYRRLATLIAQYHLIIHPFEILLRHAITTDMTSFLQLRYHFLADERGKFKTDLISSRIGNLMEAKFGTKLKTRDLRHIIQAIITHCIPAQYLTTGLVNFGLRALNHSEQTGRVHYARDIQSFGAQHPEETTQYLAVCIFSFSFYLTYSLFT
jgi:hypothetical protein